MMKKYKYCSNIATPPGILIIVITSLFIQAGASNLAAESRLTIAVTSLEREGIQTEMRGFLEAVQTIIAANNAGDPELVSVAARKVGKSSLRPHSPEFANKLPIEFRQLGMNTHLRFDLLATDAEQFKNRAAVLQQLGELMENCVACHKTYRLIIENQQ